MIRLLKRYIAISMVLLMTFIIEFTHSHLDGLAGLRMAKSQEQQAMKMMYSHFL